MPKDWRSITDEKEKYAAYLCSREWAEKKRAVHERAGGICERCRSAPIDAVHHLTYERKYNEDLDDLAGWCNNCHDFVHGHSDYDPARPPSSTPLSAMLSRGEYLTCPVAWCDEVVHFGRPTHHDDGDPIITIPMYCEHGHRWDLAISFCSAEVSARCVNIADVGWEAIEREFHA